MLKGSFAVDANFKLIKWAREIAGWSVEEAAKKLKTSVENYLKIENGEKKPTYKQLEVLAKIFKRPLTMFFLSEIPVEKPYASSFRILPKNEQEFSKDLRLIIRKARYYQSLINEILLDLGISPSPNIVYRTLDDNPLKIANELRKEFGISFEQQISWKNSYDAFNYWRALIEDRNIFIFQFKFPIEDARGFTLLDKNPPFIVLNSSENISARIFTMFHEFAHILLGITEMYIENEISTNRNIENWCDSFASEFLIPSKDLLVEIEKNVINIELIENLSKKLKVSKKAILLKLKIIGLLSLEDYKKLLSEIDLSAKKQSGFVTPYRKTILEKGRRFISYVLEARKQGIITTHDALNFLKIKLKYLPRIEKEISKY